MEVSELFCLVCNAKLEVTSCVNIFYTSLPRNETQLGGFILQVLRCLESDLRSSYVCFQCYNLFQMLEQAQWTATNIRTEILKAYESSGRRKEARTSSTSNTELLEIENKCFAENLNHEDELKITNTISHLKHDPYLKTTGGSESFNIPDKLTACKDSLAQNREVSNIHVDMGPNLNECISKILNKSMKLNLGTSAVPLGTDNGLKNEQSSREKRKSQVEGERSDLKDKGDVLSGSGHATSTTYTEEGSPKIEIALGLNRQEKMALYVHQCRVCGRLFKFASDLHPHLLKHGGSSPYECRICKTRFEAASSANLHANQEHPSVKDAIGIATEPKEGEISDFADDDLGLFPEELLGMSDNEVQDDFEWKEAVQSTEDKECISPNKSMEELDVSKETTSNPEPIKFQSGKNVKYNLKPLKHPCPTCGKKWRTPAELKTHQKSHSNLRPYMCEKCGQAYKHKHALEIHVGMHNGVNPFQCSFCNKCFTQKGALMRHLPMHTGEKPYQCELCGKRFVHHTSYNMHALSHTGKKSYQCHVCDLSLLSTSHLKRHLRVHTGEKPYSCTLCGKRFAERYNLFAHQKIHDPAEILAKETKKIQYKCKQCAILFDKKEKLDDHLRQHHNVITESTSNRKWVDNGNDIVPQISKTYTLQNENQNSSKLDIRDNIVVDQAWQPIGYAKLQSMESVQKLPQSQNTFQIGTNPLTAGLEIHKVLMDVGCNQNIISNVGVPGGSQI